VLDLLIDGATLVDGTGRPGYRGAIGVVGDRIAWVGTEWVDPPEALRRIEAAGQVVAPGFIDVHNHSDLSPLVEPAMPSTLRQGVTTVVVGNCGSCPWPPAGAAECAALAGGDAAHMDLSWRTFDAYLRRLDEAHPAVNIATLVGHGALRMEAMGLSPREPTPAEIASMRTMAAEAMQAGAFGLSTGLIYVPGLFSRTDEIVAVAEEVARAGGRYASHIRGEGEHLFRAVDEAIEIGRRSGLPAHVSHLKCETSLVHGSAAELLRRVHDAEDVTADQYPYTAWNSSLSSLLPPWAPVEGIAKLARTDLDRLRASVEDGEPGFQSSVKGVGWSRIVVVGTADPRWSGKDIEAIADATNVQPFDAMVDLLHADPETSCIGHAMSEDDVRVIVADPEIFVASDGAAISPTGPSGGLPVHPREYGTFPRVLAKYVREEHVLTLEAAIRKMTSLPADRFGLSGRGRIEEGAVADLVMFDPNTVHDIATFAAPHAFPAGIDLVMVNGAIAWDGSALGERAGSVLRSR
jgi:N-acyl-D-amino-acid deacylase